MKQEPKVSVIIPVYNTEAYLRKCLDSVVNQSLKDIEIICVDDGSTDGSLGILKEYAEKDNRITILSQENLHAGVARNKGMEYATGKYLYFMDSDDWLEDDAFIKVYHKAEEEQADIVLFGSYNAVNGKQIKRTWAINRANEPYKNKMELFCRISSAVWDKLYLHSFIKDNHILFEEGQSCNDVFFSCYSLMLANHIGCLEDYLYNYRSSADGAISRTRGDYAFYLPRAMRHIKEKLKEQKIWKENKLYFYKKYRGHLHYEFQNCTTYSQKKNLIFAMDIEDLIRCFLQNIFQNFFSVKNTSNKKYKVITLLGLKLKFKRRKHHA